MALEASDARERRFNVRRCDGDCLNAPRIETVVAGPTGPRHPLLAEIVGDPSVATASRAGVVHDLSDARIGMLLELGLLFEIDGRARQLADAAVWLHHAGPLQQSNGRADRAGLDRGQARLPVGDPTATGAKHLAVDGAHGVAIGVGLLDEEVLELPILRAV